MVVRFLTKNPVLMIGFLMVTILLFDLNRRGYFKRENLNPTSCRSALVKLDRRIPSNWTTSCDNNTMIVKVEDNLTSRKTSGENYRAVLFRQLANSLMTISKNSPEDNLERVDWIKVSYLNEGNQIDAVTEGKFLAKLSNLKSSDLIAQHIHNTVQVKEFIK